MIDEAGKDRTQSKVVVQMKLTSIKAAYSLSTSECKAVPTSWSTTCVKASWKADKATYKQIMH